MAEPQRLELGSVLDSQASTQLHAAILALRGADLELDARNVRGLGGLCLQILLAAHATWAAEGYSFSLCHVPEELAAGLSLFGVAPDLSTAGEVLGS